MLGRASSFPSTSSTLLLLLTFLAYLCAAEPNLPPLADFPEPSIVLFKPPIVRFRNDENVNFILHLNRLVVRSEPSKGILSLTFNPGKPRPREIVLDQYCTPIKYKQDIDHLIPLVLATAKTHYGNSLVEIGSNVHSIPDFSNIKDLSLDLYSNRSITLFFGRKESVSLNYDPTSENAHGHGVLDSIKRGWIRYADNKKNEVHCLSGGAHTLRIPKSGNFLHIDRNGNTLPVDSLTAMSAGLLSVDIKPKPRGIPLKNSRWIAPDYAGFIARLREAHDPFHLIYRCGSSTDESDSADGLPNCSDLAVTFFDEVENEQVLFHFDEGTMTYALRLILGSRDSFRDTKFARITNKPLFQLPDAPAAPTRDSFSIPSPKKYRDTRLKRSSNALLLQLPAASTAHSLDPSSTSPSKQDHKTQNRHLSIMMSNTASSNVPSPDSSSILPSKQDRMTHNRRLSIMIPIPAALSSLLQK